MTEVNSFWHGEELSNLEKFCISSFLRNAVKYSLYAYEAPANLPQGAILKDANEFLPRSQLFTYQAGTFNRGSVAGFSNLFRYTLIHQCGGWWTDTDVCYVNGVTENTDETFFEEAAQDGSFRVATALFKCSPGSPVLRYCLDRFSEKDVTRIVHGEVGPSLFTAAIIACQKQDVISKAIGFSQFRGGNMSDFFLIQIYLSTIVLPFTFGMRCFLPETSTKMRSIPGTVFLNV